MATLVPLPAYAQVAPAPAGFPSDGVHDSNRGGRAVAESPLQAEAKMTRLKRQDRKGEQAAAGKYCSSGTLVQDYGLVHDIVGQTNSTVAQVNHDVIYRRVGKATADPPPCSCPRFVDARQVLDPGSRAERPDCCRADPPPCSCPRFVDGRQVTQSREIVAAMSVTLLYFDGCPNWREAETQLREALRIAGRPDAVVTLQEVTTPEDADRLSFRGSPTILVDGVDPFADETAPVGLACRVFPTPDGLRGAPTVEQLAEALR